MYHFTADPRDGNIGTGCAVCCCQPATARPGETNKWSINYLPWAAPFGGPGLSDCTLFEVDQREGCTPSPNEATVVSPLLLTTPINTALNATLAGAVTNPNAELLDFSLAMFGGTSYGTIVINPDGTFVYTPNSNFTGYDRFWWQVTVGDGSPMIGETVIGVGPVAAPTVAANGTPPVKIVKGSAKVNLHTFRLTFAVAVSPAARIGCVYRLSVKQKAMDCENCYTHISCFDIKIVKC